MYISFKQRDNSEEDALRLEEAACIEMAPHFEDFKKYAHGSSMLMEYQQVWS
jgi:hypothetical protein